VDGNGSGPSYKYVIGRGGKALHTLDFGTRCITPDTSLPAAVPRGSVSSHLHDYYYYYYYYYYCCQEP
jgi:hypothetical protein